MKLVKTKRKKRTKRITKHAALRIAVKDLRAELETYQRHIRSQETRISELRAQVPAPFIWTTAEGQRLTPSQMDEQHLRNTICYLQRNLTHKFGTIRYLQTLANNVRALWEMLEEAKIRGLEV